MKCPNCQNKKIDVYEARGYTSKESPIKECDCGHVWRFIPLEGDKKRIDIIRQGKDVTGSDKKCHLPAKDGLSIIMSKRILLAEDEQTIREALTRLATVRGYEVTAVTNGVDLLRVVAAERFDVVITDLKMADLDGASAANIMKLQGDITPVIALTGVSEHNIHRVKDSFIKIFHKPIIVSKLFDYIDTLIEK